MLVLVCIPNVNDNTGYCYSDIFIGNEDQAFFFFFFQAEDGIRDRSPSRGLGDVYKRQLVKPLLDWRKLQPVRSFFKELM